MPGIIIMVPGTYAFQTIVLFNQGSVLEALRAATLGGFVVGAMALGLAAARFISQRGWVGGVLTAVFVIFNALRYSQLGCAERPFRPHRPRLFAHD